MPDSFHWSSKRPLEIRGGHRVFAPFLLPPHPHQDTGKRVECLKLGSVREEVEEGQWRWKRVGRRPDLSKVYPDGGDLRTPASISSLVSLPSPPDPWESVPSQTLGPGLLIPGATKNTLFNLSGALLTL